METNVELFKNEKFVLIRLIERYSCSIEGSYIHTNKVNN